MRYGRYEATGDSVDRYLKRLGNNPHFYRTETTVGTLERFTPLGARISCWHYPGLRGVSLRRYKHRHKLEPTRKYRLNYRFYRALSENGGKFYY